MKSPVSRSLALALALATLSCKESPTAPPDSAECANLQATFNVLALPANFAEVGTLTTASCKLSRGSYADVWEIIVPSAVSIVIDMASVDMDAFIILRNSDGENIGSDDDSGPETDAQLDGVLQAGTYYILTTTFGDDVVGSYSLNIAVNPVPPPV